MKVKMPQRQRRETLSRQLWDIAGIEFDDLFEGACKLLPGMISVTRMLVSEDTSSVIFRIETIDRGTRTVQLKLSEVIGR